MRRRASTDGGGLADRLAEGRLVGTFVKLPALEAIDLVADAGFDLAIVDLEHAQLSEHEAQRLVRHAAAIGLPAVVRIPANDAAAVNRLLEAGAAGIQLSTVRSVVQVEALVRATRYAPDGERSVSLAHPVARYGAVSVEELVRAAPPLLVGQIETGETDDPLEQILGAGLDVAFLGLTDLEVALGFDGERVRARVEEVTEAAATAKVALGAFASTPERILPDARYVALSSDVALLRTALAGAAGGVEG